MPIKDGKFIPREYTLEETYGEFVGETEDAIRKFLQPKTTRKKIVQEQLDYILSLIEKKQRAYEIRDAIEQAIKKMPASWIPFNNARSIIISLESIIDCFSREILIKSEFASDRDSLAQQYEEIQDVVTANLSFSSTVASMQKAGVGLEYVKKLEKENEVSASEIKELLIESADKDKQIVKLSETIEIQHVELEETKKQLKSSDEARETLQRANNKLGLKCEKLKKNHELLQEKVFETMKSMQEQMNAQKEDINELRRENRELKDEINELKRENKENKSSKDNAEMPTENTNTSQQAPKEGVKSTEDSKSSINNCSSTYFNSNSQSQTSSPFASATLS